MNLIVFLRYVGIILVIIGYYVLLYVNVFWGIVLRIIANIILLPWAIKNKLWDFIILLGFFLVIEFHKFYTILMGD